MPRIEKLRQLLDADPNDAFVLYGLAQEHAKLDEHDRACEFFDRCIAADATYLYAYYHKAVSQQAMGDTRAAAISLRDGLARAKAANDQKAISELQGFLDSIT